jgi:hypothetical protein
VLYTPILIAILSSLLITSPTQFLRANAPSEPQGEELMPAASIPTSCHVSKVYRSAAFTHVGPLTRVPWIQLAPSSAGVVGYLFYSIQAPPGRYNILETNGRIANDTTKILWVLRRGYGSSTLTLAGSRINGIAHFQQLFPEAVSPPANYPSIIRVPTAGCWRITVRSGTVSASAVIWVTSSNAKTN